jgi:hypothetical protein
MNGFSNYEQWKREIEAMGSVTDATMQEALTEVGAFARDAIRRRLPPGGDGRFPGYASKGILKNAIVAGRVTGSPGNQRISVGLASNAGPRTRIKAFVHEYGMTIHAKRYPYMTFKINGKWVKAKQVTIRAKHFFADGWAEAERMLPEIVAQYLRQRWFKR